MLYIPLLAQTQLLIKIPTRSRPEQFFKTLDIYYQKLSRTISYHFLISCDASDSSMNNEIVVERLKKYEHLSFYFGDTNSKIEAYNADIGKHSDFDVLLVVSDDMEPIVDKFDLTIMQKMAKHFPDFDGVLNFHDGNVGERCNTLPIIGKKFYERFKYIYHPEYKSLFCDEELTLVSRILGKEMVFYELLIKHNHPDYDSTFQSDELYKRNQTFFVADERIFKERQRHNFDLTDSMIQESITKKWSILIPTLQKNWDSFHALFEKLQSQIKDAGLEQDIEVKMFYDNGENPTGFKCNELLRQSKGYYVSFLNDMDDVAQNYITTIYKQLHSSADCVNLRGVISSNGEKADISSFNHHCVVKRQSAIQFLFAKVFCKSEDQWSIQLIKSGLLKNKAAINEPLYFITQEKKPKKIVGLVQIRNESVLIEQCLHALSLYTDGIVVLDDASSDDTVKICQSVAEKYHIEKIIQNQTSAWENRTESDNRQKLLDAGRAIGGTHFIILDADEMMSAQCAKNNYLRSLIVQLNPGDRLQLNIVHFWDSIERYRIYFNEKMKYFIFCDDSCCFYESKFLHVDRVPLNLSGGANLEFNDNRYALLHFGYINWHNVLIRQAWYKCLERVRSPGKKGAEINSWYPAHKEKELQTFPVPTEWLAGYEFFDAHLFENVEQWRCKQIFSWFKHYGKNYFNDIEIWHVNWDEIFQNNTL